AVEHRYLAAPVTALRQQGCAIRQEDCAWLFPLGHTHLNCPGRYSFTSPPPCDPDTADHQPS
ncbi:MAG TPA: hypothetical protein VK280_23060, partial [Streptosporangiaceae bacterium]|nr:hypothetical protein [Streptosporangiaceae bacterium]